MDLRVVQCCIRSPFWISIDSALGLAAAGLRRFAGEREGPRPATQLMGQAGQPSSPPSHQ